MERSKILVFCAKLLYLIGIVLLTTAPCGARTDRRSGPYARGPIVAYEGGSGGGTFTLLIKGRFRTYTYDEPVNWKGFRREEDLYLGSIITIRQRRTARPRQVQSIEYGGAADPTVRGIWKAVTSHFEGLARGDYQSSYSGLSTKLQSKIPFDSFVRKYSSTTFDLRPFTWVPPNPLARYGLISYGIGLRRLKGPKATARIAYHWFVASTWETWDYEMVFVGRSWKIEAMRLVPSRDV